MRAESANSLIADQVNAIGAILIALGFFIGPALIGLAVMVRNCRR